MKRMNALSYDAALDAFVDAHAEDIVQMAQGLAAYPLDEGRSLNRVRPSERRTRRALWTLRWAGPKSAWL